MNRKTWLRKFIAFIMLIIGFNVFINCSDSTSAQNDSEKKYDLQKNTGAVTGKIFSYDIKKDSKIVLQSQSREDEIYDIELNSENKFLIINLEPGYYRLTDYKQEFHKDIPVIKDSITVIPTFFYKQPDIAFFDISEDGINKPTVYRIVNGDTLVRVIVRCNKEIDKSYLQNLGLVVRSFIQGHEYTYATGEINIKNLEMLRSVCEVELDRKCYIDPGIPEINVPEPDSSPDIMDEETTIILDSTISNNFWFFIPLNDTNIAK